MPGSLVRVVWRVSRKEVLPVPLPFSGTDRVSLQNDGNWYHARAVQHEVLLVLVLDRHDGSCSCKQQTTPTSIGPKSHEMTHYSPN